MLDLRIKSIDFIKIKDHYIQFILDGSKFEDEELLEQEIKKFKE